jgi:hypothetical protein
MQPGWGIPNRGRHMASPDDPTKRCRGSRAPSTGKPTDQGRETGASPTPDGVAQPKAAVALVVQG